MAKTLSTSAAVFLFSLVVAGCDLILDIFQAGVWVGVLVVVALIVLVVWVFAKVLS